MPCVAGQQPDGPDGPMVEQCRSRVSWVMGRSEKMSQMLAAWARVTEHPMDMLVKAFRLAPMPAADFADAAAASNGPQQTTWE
jgi:hypothetical protein